MPDKNKEKINLIVLFVQYDQKKYNYSFETLHQIISNDNQYNSKYIIIDNSIEQDYFEIISSDIFLINGNNSDREFSAWQKGIDKLNDLRLNYDLILLINEAFLVYNDSYLLKYLKISINRCLKYNAVVGIFDKDQHNRQLSVNNYVFSKWLRSNIFFVPKNIIERLQSLVFMTNSAYDKIIPSVYPNNIYSYKDCFTDDITINELFKQKIYEWLTNEWHSKIVLNSETWNIFRIKAKAILNEALLTTKIRSLGYDIIWYAPKYIVYYEKILRKIKKIFRKYQE
jgi:hypothetical protein